MLFISFAARDLIKALVNKGYSFFGERGFDQQLHDREFRIMLLEISKE